MKYLIKIQTNNNTEEVTYFAANIVAASSWIANAHNTYHSYAMTVGRDYTITLMTDNAVQEDFTNTEVTRHQLYPIRLGVVA